LDKAVKQKTITEYATHEGDTGSGEVQIALLTRRITRLAEHLKANKHDHHSQRGLLKLIGQRKSMLSYVNNRDVNRYRGLITRLGLRK
jgi:small subunit ribosomal protein S15